MARDKERLFARVLRVVYLTPQIALYLDADAFARRQMAPALTVGTLVGREARRSQRAVDFSFELEMVEDRLVAIVEIDASFQLGGKPFKELVGLLILGGVVDDQLLHVRSEYVANRLVKQRKVLLNERRRAYL